MIILLHTFKVGEKKRNEEGLMKATKKKKMNFYTLQNNYDFFFVQSWKNLFNLGIKNETKKCSKYFVAMNSFIFSLF